MQLIVPEACAEWCFSQAGALSQGLAIPFNLGPVRNALALWLGIEPADLFLYIFLPPMLLDAAVRMDYFLFKKVKKSPDAPRRSQMTPNTRPSVSYLHTKCIQLPVLKTCGCIGDPDTVLPTKTFIWLPDKQLLSQQQKLSALVLA